MKINEYKKIGNHLFFLNGYQKKNEIEMFCFLLSNKKIKVSKNGKKYKNLLELHDKMSLIFFSEVLKKSISLAVFKIIHNLKFSILMDKEKDVYFAI